MTPESVRPPAPPSPPASREVRMAVRKLIEQGSLYQKANDLDIPPDVITILPDAAEVFCPMCKRLRVFSADYYKDRENRVREGTLIPAAASRPQEWQQWPQPWKIKGLLNSGVYRFVGLCTYCKSADFSCFLLARADGRYVQKIGQSIPPWRKPAKPEVQKALGEDFEFYQRARALIGEGYGMGACAYLRRLIEDEIDPLLDKLANVETERGSSPERIAEIEAIRTGRDFARKATAVYSVVPEILQIPGINPLITLHSAYSAGMHGLAESECLEIANDTLMILERVIVHLSNSPHEQRSYVEKVKQLEARRREM
jgi:hypothetical protein